MLLFFHLCRNNKAFEWTNECEEVVKKLKEYLETPPILTWLELKEMSYIHLATSSKAVSLVLIKEEGDVQKPIYITS